MPAQIQPEQEALEQSLLKLETALVTPVVPGELERWIGDATAAADDLEPVLARFTKEVLHKQYAEIGKSDPELLPRVESLIEEDKELLAELAHVRGLLAAIAEKLPAALKDENLVASSVTAAEKQGTALVTRIRKQTIAASTWLDEALFRDRGPVD